jgi:hypothetical protein
MITDNSGQPRYVLHMGELRSALDLLESEELGEVHDETLEQDLAELHLAAQRLEVQRLRRLAEMDRRRPWLRDGLLSTTSWCMSRFRVSAGVAATDVRTARALDGMPATRDALASGEISMSAARVLVSARESDREAFTESEALLLDAARRHSVSDLARAVGYWRHACESRRRVEVNEDPLYGRRRLHVSPTVFGMVRIDGDLDPETGETVLTALTSCVDAEARSGNDEDRRTPSQRRADALAEVCRR